MTHPARQAPSAQNLLYQALLQSLAPLLKKRFRRSQRGRTIGKSTPPLGDRQLKGIPWEVVGREVLELHQAYTRNRSEKAGKEQGTFRKQTNPLHGRLLGGQLYFLPRNIYRVSRVLRALPWQKPLLHQAGRHEGWLLAPWLQMAEDSPAVTGDEAPSVLTPPEPLPVKTEPEKGLGQAALADDKTPSIASPHPETPTGNGQVLRVLDLGCGAGAFSVAVLDFLRELGPPKTGWPQIDITLVDQSRRSLGQARRNLRAYAALALPDMPLNLHSYAHGVEAFLTETDTQPKYALAGAAMMMNELALLGPRRTTKKAGRMALAMQHTIAPGGIWVVVEGGVRKGYMQMMALREQWVKQGSVLYPCTHQKPCPLWRPTVRQWCHMAWRLPEDFFFDGLLRQHAGVEFKMRDVNASSLVVQFGRNTPSTEAQNGVTAQTSQWFHKRLGMEQTSQGEGHRPQAPFATPHGARILSNPLPAPQAAALIGSHVRILESKETNVPPSTGVLSCEENGQLGVRKFSNKANVFRGNLVSPFSPDLNPLALRFLPLYNKPRTPTKRKEKG